jgi:hypothetical protein
VVAPLSAERFKLQVTFSRQQRDKLRTAQDLLRHQQPDGDLAQILEKALDLLIARHKKLRFGVTDRPTKRQANTDGSRSRHIPQQVRREVIAREGMACSFVSEDGKRCGATAWLELDHILPHA